MSETKETDGKPNQGSRKTMTLNLKRPVEAGQVRQNFSQGRSKAVVVEKKKKRVLTPGTASAAENQPVAPEEKAPVVQKQEVREKPAPTQQQAKRQSSQRGGSGQSSRSGSVLKSLSSEEHDARARALADARVRAVEEAKIAQEQAILQAEIDRERAIEEKARKALEAEEKANAPEVSVMEVKPKEPTSQPSSRTDNRPQAPRGAENRSTQSRPGGPGSAGRDSSSRDGTRDGGHRDAGPRGRKDIAPALPVVEKTAKEGIKVKTTFGKVKEKGADFDKLVDDEDAERNARLKKAKVVERVVAPKKTTETRLRGRLTINNALNDDERERSLASLRRKRERQKKQTMGIVVEREKISREVVVPEAITIQELGNRMAVRGVDIIKFLMKQGQMHKINDLIDADMAQLIAEEFGHTVKRVADSDVEEGFIGDDDVEDHLEWRAPVVTVMGHVDHGKTSLLDALRQQNVVAGEAGGITQHIGAYQVTTAAGQKITFIDTPGHEAFTAMRARGAKVTDIVILVVAADDGVKPQTVEAINHAKAANVPLIVAINKIDKPNVDPLRVRTDLLQHEIVVESMGGEVLEIEVSALKRINLDKLMEAVLLQAEVLDLKANPNRSAEGVVIEAKLDKGRGPVGTVLIQRGTLKVGDIVVAGHAWGKVRALIDDQGHNVTRSGPSQPVEILGFGSAPEAGDQIAVVENESRAREITEYRLRKRRDKQAAGVGSGLSLEQMMTKLKEQGRQEFTLLVKADVQGSVEAISAALEKLGNEEVSARIIHAAVGGITESDVTLASASKAPILGFNVRANQQAREAAERGGIEIRYYSVIYDLVDDIKAAMSGLLSPEMRETFLGNARILEVFNITKVGKVAGCRITDGKVERGARVRLIRDNVVIHEGKLSTLKRFKDEVKEVSNGQECGMAFESYQDMREGDVIECFHVEEIKRSL